MVSPCSSPTSELPRRDRGCHPSRRAPHDDDEDCAPLPSPPQAVMRLPSRMAVRHKKNRFHNNKDTMYMHRYNSSPSLLYVPPPFLPPTNNQYQPATNLHRYYQEQKHKLQPPSTTTCAKPDVSACKTANDQGTEEFDGKEEIAPVANTHIITDPPRLETPEQECEMGAPAEEEGEGDKPSQSPDSIDSITPTSESVIARPSTNDSRSAPANDNSRSPILDAATGTRSDDDDKALSLASSSASSGTSSNIGQRAAEAVLRFRAMKQRLQQEQERQRLKEKMLHPNRPSIRDHGTQTPPPPPPPPPPPLNSYKSQSCTPPQTLPTIAERVLDTVAEDSDSEDDSIPRSLPSSSPLSHCRATEPHLGIPPRPVEPPRRKPPTHPPRPTATTTTHHSPLLVANTREDEILLTPRRTEVGIESVRDSAPPSIVSTPSSSPSSSSMSQSPSPRRSPSSSSRSLSPYVQRHRAMRSHPTDSQQQSSSSETPSWSYVQRRQFRTVVPVRVFLDSSESFVDEHDSFECPLPDQEQRYAHMYAQATSLQAPAVKVLL